MTMRALLLPLLGAFLCTACGSGGTSTREMERAAMDKTRHDLGLAADAPLETTVWTGKSVDGQVTLCGTVSSRDGAGQPIQPQRFAATGGPVKVLVFEPAHDAMVTSRPDMFQSWQALCAGGQAS
jgi:hypothetical protein